MNPKTNKQKESPVKITIKRLSETEYDLMLRAKGRPHMDAHLRREVNLNSKTWLLDVFRPTHPEAEHVGTFDDAGNKPTPNWQAVFDILTDYV